MAELPVIKVKHIQCHPAVEEWRWNEMLRTLGEEIVAQGIGVERVPVVDPERTDATRGIMAFYFVPMMVMRYNRDVIERVYQVLKLTEPQSEWTPEPCAWNPPDSEAWKQ